MTDEAQKPTGPANPFATLLQMQNAALSAFLPRTGDGSGPLDDAVQWADVARRLQTKWFEFQQEQMSGPAAQRAMTDPSAWQSMLETWYQRVPLARPEVQQKAWSDGIALWQSTMAQFGIAAQPGAWPLGAWPAGVAIPELPRSDRRFADPQWREQPMFAMIHQTYLLMAEQIMTMAEALGGSDPERQEQLRFATRTLVEALSPANFALTNPQVIARAMETRGESLVKGLDNLLGDLRRGQLTHTDPTAFRLGENIAATPGKIIHETALYQLIQYTPTTETVLEVPLVIFPPWINRFYILDLNPAKSFVRWALEQGISVFMVSWKSADASMAELIWDDYILSQIEAIDTVRNRLNVPAVHTIGYCVAGTTLAATLALLAKRGKAGKVKSATFFTAQVDFEDSGELNNFIDDQQIEMLAKLSPDGFLDGRYMALAFNLLRGTDLIWNYVTNNYLMGQDYPAFDLLHWNGDTTNLPLKWHQAYLRDLYRDNRLVQPGSIVVDGTPIDLTAIETPAYIQAGREDHIAPPHSVWRITDHLQGPVTFVLAGSGHIAGVVNPPAANKYQYWTNPTKAETLDAFIAGATEHKGSWWPHWVAWLRAQDDSEVRAKGKRVPGGKNDRVIEDAPGRYVKTR